MPLSAAVLFFFDDPGEMLYAYRRPRGRDGGYAGLPAKPPVYPLKPQGWPSARLEGQAGTRDWLMQFIGIPDCGSPSRLGSSGLLVLTAGPPSRGGGIRLPPSFQTVGGRGHTVRPPSSWTRLVASGPRSRRPGPEGIARRGGRLMATPPSRALQGDSQPPLCCKPPTIVWGWREP